MVLKGWTCEAASCIIGQSGKKADNFQYSSKLLFTNYLSQMFKKHSGEKRQWIDIKRMKVLVILPPHICTFWEGGWLYLDSSLIGPRGQFFNVALGPNFLLFYSNTKTKTENRQTVLADWLYKTKTDILKLTVLSSLTYTTKNTENQYTIDALG